MLSDNPGKGLSKQLTHRQSTEKGMSANEIEALKQKLDEILNQVNTMHQQNEQLNSDIKTVSGQANDTETKILNLMNKLTTYDEK